MSRSHTYYREIENLSTEIKRLNGRLKELRQRRRQQEKYLYDSMKMWHETKVGNYTIKKLEKKAHPPPRHRRKGQKAKKQDALHLFRQIGIPSPEDFWQRFDQTQRGMVVEPSPFSI